MEILLLQDIVGVGKKNDLLQVGDGYALNHLLPKRAALVATPLVRRRYAELIRKRAEERENERQVQTSSARAIAGKTVTFKRKSTKNGKLYAAISEANIAQGLKDQHGLEVAEEMVQIPDQIKAIGSFAISIRLAGQQQPVTVVVEAEEAAK